MNSKASRQIRRLFLVLILVILFIAIILGSPFKNLQDLSKTGIFMQNLKDNPLAPAIFVLCYILAVVFALPAYMLTFLAGPLFGIGWGSLWVIVGTNLGCQITFWISRFLGRDYIQRFLKAGSFSERISRQLETNGFLILFLLRLVAVIPFPVMNYLAGLTLIKHRDYAIATFLGTLPGTFLYVYLAATAFNFKKNPLGILVPVACIILFAAVTVIISQKYKLFKKDHSSLNDENQ
jgi:Uncharacterized conserved protein